MPTVEHLNPSGLPHNPAFTQAVAVSGAHRTLYVGGQNAVDHNEEVVGKGDIAAQTGQVLGNLRRVLQAAGGDLENIVKWNVLVVEGQRVGPALAVFQQEWSERAHPPAITVAFVAGLANPDFLVEIDAIAALPD